MSNQVIIDRFDGGQAEDVRTHNSSESEKSLNFDIFTNPHKLIPYGDSVAETVASQLMTDVQISDVDISQISSTFILTGSGYESAASNKIGFYTKSDLVTNFSNQANAAGGGNYQKGSLCIYKNKAYALAYDGTTYTLYRYDSAGTVTSCGTITSANTGFVRPFVHPEDNMMYIITGTIITRYDGVNNIGTPPSTSYSSILPTGSSVTSICDYGSYLAIADTPDRANGSSIVYLWGRDGTLNTFQASINFGEGEIRLLENLNNVLVAVMYPQNSQFNAITPKIIVKGYSGGLVETLKSITITSLSNLTYIKAKNQQKLYFGIGGDDACYVFGKNKLGNWIITKDRYYFNGTTIGNSLAGLSIIGDVLWRCFATIGGVYTVMRSKVNALAETISYTSTSLFRTTINPNMKVSDRYNNKQLDSVRVAYTGKSSGTVTLEYSIDGSSFTSIIAETGLAAGEFVKESNSESTGIPLGLGREIQFQVKTTGGVEVKEISYYYTKLPTSNG